MTAATSAKCILSVHGLHYTYPDGMPALDGVDFRLNAGETVALFGANGSGKTTFGLHLNGTLRGSGTIDICGLRLNSENLPEIRRQVGMVFQDPDDQLFMPSVLEDVMFGPLSSGVPPPEAMRLGKAALAAVGIHSGFERAPYHLSAGEKRRVAIAGVLACDPEILVLDEPTTFLDPPARRALLNTLRVLPQAKVLITHDADFAEAVAQRAVFFKSGRIVADGTPAGIAARFDWLRV